MKNALFDHSRIIASLILGITCITNLFAQKVDLDREYIKVEYVQLPSNPIKNKPLTYSFISNDPKVEDNVKIFGLERINNNASLNISLQFEPINISEIKIEEIVTEKKDDNGKVISRTKTFQPVVRYKTNAEFNYNDPNTNEESGWNFGSSHTFKGKEYSTHKKASDYYKLNEQVLINQFELEFINSSISRANKFLNSKFGYQNAKYNELFWILDSESNPEYSGHKKALADIKTLLNKITSEANTEELKSEAQLTIDYFNTVIPKFPKDKRKHKKMRYASYYNIAKILYHLDMPEKAIEYANKLIENDYDEKDGKRIITSSKKMMELFKVNNTKTRHFKTETKDSRTFEEPENPEIVLVKEVEVKKPITVLELTGNREIDNRICENLLDEIQLFLMAENRAAHPFTGKYIKENSKTIGKEFTASYLYEKRYDNITLVNFENKIIGVKIGDNSLGLIFSENKLLKEIHKKYGSSDKTSHSYIIHRNDQGKMAGMKKFYQEDRSKIESILSFSYKGDQISLIGINMLRRRDDKIEIKFLENSENKHHSTVQFFNKKWKPHTNSFIYTKKTPSIVQLDQVTTYQTKKAKKPDNYSTVVEYNESNKVIQSVKSFTQYKDKTGEEIKMKITSHYQYRGKKKIRTVIIRENLITPSESMKTIDIPNDLTPESANAPEYQWKHGTYKFDNKGDLYFVNRDRKHKVKTNGIWSNWKYNSY